MQTPESASTTDYIYYPIAYPNMFLAFAATLNTNRYAIRVPWATPVDKEKFIDGIDVDNIAGFGAVIMLHIISIGF